MTTVKAEVIRRRSADPHEFVDAAVLGKAGVNVAPRVDADAVDVAAFHAGEYIASSIADADIGRVAVGFLLGDIVVAVLAAGDVVGSAHPGPLTEIAAVRREELNAPVRAVGDEEIALVVERDRMRQVELARCAARSPPRCLELTVGRK